MSESVTPLNPNLDRLAERLIQRNQASVKIRDYSAEEIGGVIGEYRALAGTQDKEVAVITTLTGRKLSRCMELASALYHCREVGNIPEILTDDGEFARQHGFDADRFLADAILTFHADTANDWARALRGDV